MIERLGIPKGLFDLTVAVGVHGAPTHVACRPFVVVGGQPVRGTKQLLRARRIQQRVCSQPSRRADAKRLDEICEQRISP